MKGLYVPFTKNAVEIKKSVIINIVGGDYMERLLFQKLECNREKPLYCGLPTVFNKKKRLASRKVIYIQK